MTYWRAYSKQSRPELLARASVTSSTRLLANIKNRSRCKIQPELSYGSPGWGGSWLLASSRLLVRPAELKIGNRGLYVQSSGFLEDCRRRNWSISRRLWRRSRIAEYQRCFQSFAPATAARAPTATTADRLSGKH